MAHFLLVDGMNLAWKAKHAYNLTTKSGVDTSVIYGFFAQLSSVVGARKIRTVVVWDSGYDERLRISEEGIKAGIVKLAYKSNRNTEEIQDNKKIIHPQLGMISELLDLTDVKQVRMSGYEADDIIASYCEKVKTKADLICYTCDKDYYQLLDDKVSILRRLNGEERIITRTSFKNDFGIEPHQWAEVGALCGDHGDCIIGVPGCGEDTALKYIREYGTALNTVSALSAKFDPIRAVCPDITDQEKIDKLSDDFGECYAGMPYSGVAMALLNGEIKKQKKIDLKIAMYQDRIRLALKLKRMYRDIAVPNIQFTPSYNQDAFISYCKNLEMNGLASRSEDFKLLSTTTR